MQISPTESLTPAAVETAARVSIATGVAVLTLKTVAWRLTGSVALGSDAIESIVNVTAALAMWAAVRVARRPPDAGHPFGHGKAEYLSAVFEGGMVLVAAVEILREALPRIVHPVPARALGAGVLVSLIASACNGALGWFLLRRGRVARSPALHADGVHVLTDVVTSAGVIVGVLAARATGWWPLDGLIAAVVAVQILWAGWRLVRRSVGALMDEALDADEARALAAVIEREARAGGALEVHGLRMRYAGATVFCDLHLVVPGAMAVEAAHALCDRVEAQVTREQPHVDITIHVEPDERAERPVTATAATPIA